MKFISRGLKLRIVLVPSRYMRDAFGARSYVAGKDAQFENSQFETSNPVIIKMLKESKSFGVEFWVADGQKTEITEEGKKMIEEDKKTADSTLVNCPECGKRFVNEGGLRLHMMAKHK